MPLKTPKFWYEKSTDAQKQCIKKCVLPCLLQPLSLLYQLGHKTKLFITKTHKAPIPIICVGNVTTGGSGKTPVCIALCDLVNKYALFSNPYFLTRGYGGNDSGPRRIEDHDTAQNIGDEPLLLASHSDTMVSVNRPYGARKAHELGADLVIMDDGLQNSSLHKDLSFLVLDGTLGLGNKKTLPAGPLREPFTTALNRSDALVIIGEDTYGIRSLITVGIPIFEAHITPDLKKQALPNTGSYIAFAGLGTPNKFFNTLRTNGLELTDMIEFADHHLYTKTDIQRLLDRAKNSNANLITTEKDYVRLPKEMQKQVYMYPITLKWNDESALVHFIAEKIKR
jgi:tetraacyldisaccharide 4'-kinase